MEILSPGEKLKRIRLELGLNQNDLSNELVTRSLISMIENGKRNLTTDTANILVNRLNQFYSPLGKTITLEYLMESEKEQVTRYIAEKSKLILSLMKGCEIPKVQLEQIFGEIIQLAKAYQFHSKLAEIYLHYGKYYYISEGFNEALTYYNEALEFYLIQSDYEKVAYLYNEIGKCNYMLYHFDTAVIFYHKAYETLSQHKLHSEVKINTLYNIVLAYYKSGKHDRTLQAINKLKEMDVDSIKPRLMNQILLLESTVYKDLGDYERAEVLLKMLLEKRERLNIDTLALIYGKLSMLYREKGDYEKALTHINLAISMKDHIDAEYFPNILLQLAEYYIAIEEHEKAINTLNESFHLVKKLLNYEGLMDVVFLLARTYLSLRRFSEAEETLIKAEEIINGRNQEALGRKNQLYTYFIELYTDMGSPEKCKAHIAKLRYLYPLS